MTMSESVHWHRHFQIDGRHNTGATYYTIMTTTPPHHLTKTGPSLTRSASRRLLYFCQVQYGRGSLANESFGPQVRSNFYYADARALMDDTTPWPPTSLARNMSPFFSPANLLLSSPSSPPHQTKKWKKERSSNNNHPKKISSTTSTLYRNK